MYAMYKEVEIAETKEMVGTGWLPPLPDLRDYTEEEPDIARIAKKLGISPTKKTTPSLPAKVDLRQLVGLRNKTKQYTITHRNIRHAILVCTPERRHVFLCTACEPYALENPIFQNFGD